jgi:hypothetical protein
MEPTRAFTLPTSVSGIQAVQKAAVKSKAEAEKEAADAEKKKAADAKKVKDMKAVGLKMAQSVDPTKVQPMLPGMAGAPDLTSEAKQYYKDVQAVNIPYERDEAPIPPEPVAEVPAYAPPPLALGSPAAAAAAAPPANTTETNLKEFKDAIGTQDKFRKAGFMDILNAAASGWVGKESEYSRQRDAFNAKNDALLASAREEAVKLKMMAEEYKRRGDEQSAAAANQAAENAKDRALRREEMTAKNAGDLNTAMAKLANQLINGGK